PRFERDDRGERRSYGDRDQARGRYGSRPGGGERRSFDRGERPSYGREDRPRFERDDRGNRPFGDRGAFRREDPGSRTRYGRSREDRTGGPEGTPSRQREELPELAPDITAEELDKEIREELRSLPLDLADLISRHLVAAERALAEDEPERAYEHTKVARRFAARIGVVREAVGIAAYRAGHFAEALSDLRAARRMTGSDAFLPIMADCERGLGRPERALDLVRSKEAERLDRTGRIELAIVESGARRDLGQKDAAVITLQRLPELRDTRPHPWSARLAFAYADALADAGHEAAATDWFGRAMAFDEDGETEAAERYAELTGAVIEDLEEDFDDEDYTDEDLSTESPSGGDAGPETYDVDDEDDLDDEVEINDVAALDAEIEDEDDLDEEESLIADAFRNDVEDVRDAEESDVLKTELVGEGTADEKPSEESDEQETSGKIDVGVTPAFIEPDFGDVLGDTATDEDGPGEQDKASRK
ncbi:hypothetical protein, partial [Streptosporangium fragile]|uniref:hypothetical protein n=1 Tax=Streptosporangium fragile TaxID=46186 RepID=UPI0031E679C0